jgi:hypothetical protein
MFCDPNGCSAGRHRETLQELTSKIAVLFSPQNGTTQPSIGALLPGINHPTPIFLELTLVGRMDS